MTTSPKTSSLKEIDIKYHLRHYLDLFWRWKFFIVIIAPLVMAGWTFYILKFGTIKQELTATALIGLGNTSSVTSMRSVQERAPSIQEKIALVKSRLLINEVVNNLSLYFVLSKFERREVFDSLYCDTTAPLGTYEFKINSEDNQLYEITYTNREYKIENRLIRRGKIASLDTLYLPGMFLKFKNTFLLTEQMFRWDVIHSRFAVDRVQSKISASPQGGNDRYNVNESYLMISMKGTDYGLITQIVNTMAEVLVEKNLSFRKRRSTEVLSVLEKQLEKASTQLKTSEDMLREFRTLNPTVGLSQEMQGAISTITQIETTKYSLKSSLDEAIRIKELIQVAEKENLVGALGEAVIYLNSVSSTSAPIYQGELNALMEKKVELDRSYAKSHPLFIENSRSFELLRGKVLKSIVQIIQSMQTDLQRNDLSLKNLSSNLHRLPQKEMRLAELQRQQQIDTDIHSSILGKYNEARVTDAAEVADMYIMDFAVVPIPFLDFINLLLRLGIGVAIGIALGFGPAIIIDLFERTVRTENELKKLLPFPVLETIPFVKKRSKKLKNTDYKTDETALLLNSDIDKYIVEIYRSIRTKIRLATYGKNNYKLCVTSLDASEGKSTISSNIGIILAQQGVKTLLIDGDLRRGVQHNNFKVNKTPGLSEMLAWGSINDNSIKSAIKPTTIENLSVLTTGKNPENSQELIASVHFEKLLDLVSGWYDFVIIDSPPLQAASDAVVFAHVVDSYIAVVRAGKTDVIELKKRISEYKAFSQKIAGVILNMAANGKRLKYYKYSNYYVASDLEKKPVHV